MDRKNILKQAISGSRIGNKTAHIPVFWEGWKGKCRRRSHLSAIRE